jgi:hypothetical protein
MQGPRGIPGQLSRVARITDRWKLASGSATDRRRAKNVAVGERFGRLA